MLTLVLSGDLGPLTSGLQLVKQSQPHPGTTLLAFTARLPWPLLLKTQEFSRRVAALVPALCSKMPLWGGGGGGGSRKAGRRATRHACAEPCNPPTPTSWRGSGGRFSLKKKKRKVKTATLSIKQEKEAKPQTSIFN